MRVYVFVDSRDSKQSSLSESNNIVFPPSAPSEYLEDGAPKEKRPFLFQNASPRQK